jgi:hypothetical protein
VEYPPAFRGGSSASTATSGTPGPVMDRFAGKCGEHLKVEDGVEDALSVLFGERHTEDTCS